MGGALGAAVTLFIVSGWWLVLHSLGEGSLMVLVGAMLLVAIAGLTALWAGIAVLMALPDRR